MRSVLVAASVALLLVGNVAVVSAAEQAVGYQGFPIGQVVPKPRKIEYADERLTLWEGTPKACVVVAQDAHPALKLAARELAARPGRIASVVWPGIAGAMPRLEVVSRPHEATKFPVAIVLAIRSAGGISLPKQVGAEGYAVTWRKDGKRRIVYCIGADHRGAYYGAQSLQQLMDTRERRIVLRVAEIEDWPVFKIRCSGNDGSIPGGEGVCERAVEWLPHLKLNGWAVGQSYIWPDNWRETPRDRLEPLKRACTKARETDVIDVIFQIHPFRGRARDKQFNMVISNPEDVDAFIGLCDDMLTAGAKGINFRADDYHPLSPPDQKRFGDKATAHIHLIDEMHKRLKARHPDYYLIFCPPFYQGRSARRTPDRTAYMRRIATLPADVHIMWTGDVTRSLEITHEQIAAYKALIGRDPFLWDNTVYAHRGRYGYSTRHPGYLFDTFATKYPDDYGVTCPGIRYNWGYGDHVTTKVGNINIADYMWNPAGYDPETSLRQALAIEAGARAVDDLLALREAYYELKDAHDAGKSGELAVFEKMRQAAAALPAIVERIRASSPNPALQATISRYQATATRIYERASTALAPVIAARKSRLLDFDFSQPPWQEAVKGKWTVKRTRKSAQLTFPNGTRSFAGAFGCIAADLAVPPSPTGRYYLLFSAYDSYDNSGTPPSAWPGYLCKQALVGDAVVWDDDVEGREPPPHQGSQIVDVTRLLLGKKRVRITFRGFDKRGVGNMGSTLRFANACLVAGPCKLLASAVEVPDCPALRSLKSFTIVVGFTPRQVGKRSLLYAKQKPMQYFAYIHESGHATAGVFTGGAEAGLTTKRKVTPATRHTLAFVFDQGLIKLFLDGALEAERRIEGDVDPGNGQLTIGSYSSESTYFDGVIHEVRLFSRALSQDELAPGQAEAKAPAARDIAVNGQCEELDKEGKPLGWRCSGEKAEWGASDQAHAGKRSVVVRAPAGKGEVALVHGAGDGYGAPPRTVHRFAAWAKGDAGRIVIEPRGDAGSLGTFPVWVGSEWKRFEGTFVTRADTRRFVLAFRVPRAAEGDAPRTLCVDDLTLEQLPPGLAGWWKLDDPKAAVARDLVGACPDATIYRRWHVGEP